ncbi:uncharacterized protein DS421_8g225140 [Arachis hypogaea]|nr:uncharacterized protein DS421_8g225140 [Arachis hypogaea]
MQDDLKKFAADKAVKYVKSGMVLASAPVPPPLCRYQARSSPLHRSTLQHHQHPYFQAH